MHIEAYLIGSKTQFRFSILILCTPCTESMDQPPPMGRAVYFDINFSV